MVIQSAKHCYIKDEFNNKFIDTSMGSGAQILGHGNALSKKVAKQIKRGTIYTIPNIHIERVNFLLKTHINPKLSNTYVFCNSGAEANTRAIRLARAYTKRDKIGIFAGGWHGGIDGMIESAGVPPDTNNLFKVLPYNTSKSFQEITSDLAAIIIEPTQGSNPRSDVQGFLRKLQETCKEKEVLFIADEVMTGFRLGMRGGCGVFDIQPDIVTYGKVLGGGFPIGAVGGKEEIMETKNMFYGGTFSGNPISMYSAKLILECITNKKRINYNHLNYCGEFLRNSLNYFFSQNDIKIRVTGCGPINRIIFTDMFIKNREERDLNEDTKKRETFYFELKKQGVFVNTNGIIHISMAHSKKVIKTLINKIKNVALSS